MKNQPKFKFIGINDTGPESGACCPHCGAEGRYIYMWEEDGVRHGAMAGCYKALTGIIEKGDTEKYFELLAVKQAKNKPLNGWDKNIIRLMGFLKEGKYTAQWVDSKIHEVLSERKRYLAQHRY
jgi:hypothetical protein